MKGILNPFEPWRPADIPIPPPIHASRPWRPAAPTPTRPAREDIPFAEPVEPPVRNRARNHCGKRKDAARVASPKGPTNADAKPTGEPSRILGLLGAFFLLAVLTFVGLSWLGGSHFFRVVVTLLAVTVGFTFALAPAAQRTWSTRLGWMATGLALAGMSAWFVPTLSGTNLWSAYRQVEELRTLPAGAIAEYQRGAADRGILVEEFPSFAPDVRAAELAWLRRTVDEAIENAERRADLDPRGALAELQQLNQELRWEQFVSVRDELQAAQQRISQAQTHRNLKR